MPDSVPLDSLYRGDDSSLMLPDDGIGAKRRRRLASAASSMTSCSSIGTASQSPLVKFDTMFADSTITNTIYGFGAMDTMDFEKVESESLTMPTFFAACTHLQQTEFLNEILDNLGNRYHSWKHALFGLRRFYCHKLNIGLAGTCRDYYARILRDVVDFRHQANLSLITLEFNCASSNGTLYSRNRRVDLTLKRLDEIATCFCSQACAFTPNPKNYHYCTDNSVPVISDDGNSLAPPLNLCYAGKRKACMRTVGAMEFFAERGVVHAFTRPYSAIHSCETTEPFTRAAVCAKCGRICRCSCIKRIFCTDRCPRDCFTTTSSACTPCDVVADVISDDDVDVDVDEDEDYDDHNDDAGYGAFSDVDVDEDADAEAEAELDGDCAKDSNVLDKSGKRALINTKMEPTKILIVASKVDLKHFINSCCVAYKDVCPQPALFNNVTVASGKLLSTYMSLVHCKKSRLGTIFAHCIKTGGEIGVDLKQKGADGLLDGQYLHLDKKQGQSGRATGTASTAVAPSTLISSHLLYKLNIPRGTIEELYSAIASHVGVLDIKQLRDASVLRKWSTVPRHRSWRRVWWRCLDNVPIPDDSPNTRTYVVKTLEKLDALGNVRFDPNLGVIAVGHLQRRNRSSCYWRFFYIKESGLFKAFCRAAEYFLLMATLPLEVSLDLKPMHWTVCKCHQGEMYRKSFSAAKHGVLRGYAMAIKWFESLLRDLKLSSGDLSDFETDAQADVSPEELVDSLYIAKVPSVGLDVCRSVSDAYSLSRRRKLVLLDNISSDATSLDQFVIQHKQFRQQLQLQLQLQQEQHQQQRYQPITTLQKQAHVAVLNGHVPTAHTKDGVISKVATATGGATFEKVATTKLLGIDVSSLPQMSATKETSPPSSITQESLTLGANIFRPHFAAILAGRNPMESSAIRDLVIFLTDIREDFGQLLYQYSLVSRGLKNRVAQLVNLEWLTLDVIEGDVAMQDVVFHRNSDSWTCALYISACLTCAPWPCCNSTSCIKYTRGHDAIAHVAKKMKPCTVRYTAHVFYKESPGSASSSRCFQPNDSTDGCCIVGFSAAKFGYKGARTMAIEFRRRFLKMAHEEAVANQGFNKILFNVVANEMDSFSSTRAFILEEFEKVPTKVDSVQVSKRLNGRVEFGTSQSSHSNGNGSGRHVNDDDDEFYDAVAYADGEQSSNVGRSNGKVEATVKHLDSIDVSTDASEELDDSTVDSRGTDASTTDGSGSASGSGVGVDGVELSNLIDAKSTTASVSTVDCATSSTSKHQHLKQETVALLGSSTRCNGVDVVDVDVDVDVDGNDKVEASPASTSAETVQSKSSTHSSVHFDSVEDCSCTSGGRLIGPDGLVDLNEHLASNATVAKMIKLFALDLLIDDVFSNLKGAPLGFCKRHMCWLAHWLDAMDQRRIIYHRIDLYLNATRFTSLTTSLDTQWCDASNMLLQGNQNVQASRNFHTAFGLLIAIQGMLHDALLASFAATARSITDARQEYKLLYRLHELYTCDPETDYIVKDLRGKSLAFADALPFTFAPVYDEATPPLSDIES